MRFICFNVRCLYVLFFLCQRHLVFMRQVKRHSFLMRWPMRSRVTAPFDWITGWWTSIQRTREEMERISKDILTYNNSFQIYWECATTFQERGTGPSQFDVIFNIRWRHLSKLVSSQLSCRVKVSPRNVGCSRKWFFLYEFYHLMFYYAAQLCSKYLQCFYSCEIKHILFDMLKIHWLDHSGSKINEVEKDETNN